MDISAIQQRIDAANLSPEDLAHNSQLTEEQKLSEAARQFEAILLRQILESTQKTVIQSKFADNSTAASIYRDLVTCQLADQISKSGTLGLAKSLEHQLMRQHPASAGPDRNKEAQPTAHAISDVARPDFCSVKSHMNLE